MVFFILLLLENQCEIEDSERYEKDFEIQYPIYGDEIKDKYSSLPDEASKVLPRFLTEFCFGDFYTRKAIDIKTRELLILCILTTLNSTNQIIPHAIANIKLGNSKETIYEGLIQCLPYIGFPSVFNAINAIMSIE